MRGRFITFEGGEGAGKSTQIRLLAHGLETAGITVCLTREPGGSPGAEEIRGLLVTGEPGRWDAVTELLLLHAARRDHVQRLIAPALARGHWVLCDRFSDSTMAYQGYGHGLDPGRIEALRHILPDDLQPDLTILLDIAPETGIARTEARARHGREAPRQGSEDRFERMEPAFHARIREGFRAIAAAEPERVALIDAGHDTARVQEAVAALVRGRFGVPV